MILDKKISEYSRINTGVFHGREKMGEDHTWPMHIENIFSYDMWGVPELKKRFNY